MNVDSVQRRARNGALSTGIELIVKTWPHITREDARLVCIRVARLEETNGKVFVVKETWR